MSAFLDETGTLITVDHSNPLPTTVGNFAYTKDNTGTTPPTAPFAV